MDNIENTNEDERWREMEKAHRRGKVAAGLLIILAGVLFMARETGAILPHWLFSWKTILIGVGLVLAVRHNFRRPGAYVMMLVGGAFLLADFFPELSVRPFLWPVLLILLGLFIVLKPVRRRHYYGRCRGRWQRGYYREEFGASSAANTGGPSGSAGVDDDYLDSTAVFGGVKKNILSKNFRGGEVVNVFGGTELNLTQADFKDGIELEITAVFGGTKLIIPANWEIKSEIVAVLGGVDDKRPLVQGPAASPAKTLKLTGTVFLGGVEIRSF
jgi:hypothetical protein